MQKGFLGAAPRAAAPPPTGPTGAPAGGDGRAGAEQPPPVLSPEAAERNLQQCLELLRGPTDERRFVGLLLVTKILPAGDEATIQRVFDAEGFTFITRLLLPLSSGAWEPPAAATQQQAEEALQQQAALTALGLAVLSSFARVPKLVAAGEMVEKVPLLLKVAREGGVGPVLAAAAGLASAEGAPAGQQGDSSAAAADAGSVEDALECALAVAQSGSEGRAVVLESGTLGVTFAVLARGADSGAAPAPAAVERHARCWLLAVRLVAVVLAWHGGTAAVEGHVEDCQQLVPLLAGLLALPATLPSPPSPKAATAAGAGAAPAPVDLAVLQLEALHALRLLLMAAAPEDSPVLHAALARSAQQAQQAAGGWPQQVAAGLSLVLRGRVSPVERHAALQVAAAMVELCDGPAWLLMGAGSTGGVAAAGAAQHSSSAGGSSSSKGGPNSAGSFFQLLVEMVKIETSVLLLDSLAPSAAVPLPGTWAPRLAPLAASSAGSEASLGDVGEEDVEEGGAEGAPMEVDGNQPEAGGGGSLPAAAAAGAASSGSADVGLLKQVLRSDSERQALEARLQQAGAGAASNQAGGDPAADQAGGVGPAAAAAPSKREPPVSVMQRVDAVQLPTEMKVAGPSEPAGERAARLLPACFALIEACIEALAQNSERAEEEEEGMEEWGTVGQATPVPPPLLPPSVALRALGSLQEVCEGLLQFLEQTVGAPSGAVGLVQQALAAGAVRVVGRFCAEVPDAFGPRLRALLSRLLGAGAPLGGDGLLPFLLPVLLQHVAFEQGEGGSAAERAAWLGLLRSKEVLPHVASFVAAATSLFSPDGGPGPAEEAELAGTQLLPAALLLLYTLRPSSAPLSSVEPLEPQALGSALHVVPTLLATLQPLAQQLQRQEQQGRELSLSGLRRLAVLAALVADLATAALQQQQQETQLGAQLQQLSDGQQQQLSAAVVSALKLAVTAQQRLACSGGEALAEAEAGSELEDFEQALEALVAAAQGLVEVSPHFAAACAGNVGVQGLLDAEGLEH